MTMMMLGGKPLGSGGLSRGGSTHLLTSGRTATEDERDCAAPEDADSCSSVASGLTNCTGFVPPTYSTSSSEELQAL